MYVQQRHGIRNTSRSIINYSILVRSTASWILDITQSSINHPLLTTAEFEGMRGPTLTKIAYVILKSFDFIEIKMISSDFNNDFRLQKSIKCVGDLTQDILLSAYNLFIRRLLSLIMRLYDILQA